MADQRFTGPLNHHRLTPGGPGGTDATDWALRVTLALVLAAGAWFAIAALRPLPAGQGQPPPPIPELAEIPSREATITQRERTLAALNEAGNIFASDRRNWPVQRIAADDETSEPDNPADEPAGRGRTPDTVSAEAIAQGVADINDIPIARDAPVAVTRRLEQLKLRGVYRSEDGPVAMIGKKTNPASEPLRPGDTLDDGEWVLVAIDDQRHRVILNRSGLNFELLLYDIEIARDDDAPQARPTISATNQTGDVEIGLTTLDGVATELRDAGMDRQQINELIELAQQDPAQETQANTTETTGDQPKKKVAVPPAMPPEMVQLFKAMAEGSREVVKPDQTPKPEAPEAPEEDKADDADSGADGGGGDDPADDGS